MNLFIADLAGMETSDSNRYLEAAHRLGANFLRCPVPWSFLKPLSNQMDRNLSTKIDNFMARAGELGLKVIAIIGGTPCWLADMPDKDCTSREGRTKTGLTRPKSYELLRAHAAEIVDRWPFHGVEPQNEPNLHEELAEDATEFTAAIYDGIKKDSRRPETLVIAGGLAGGSDAIGYLGEMYAAGLKGRCDAISIHPYNFRSRVIPFTSGPSWRPWHAEDRELSLGQLLPALRRVILENGDDVPMWITEYGYTTSPRHRFIRFVTEEERSEYIRYALDQGSRLPYLAGMSLFQLVDDKDPTRSGQGFGLIDAQLREKESFEAIRRTFVYHARSADQSRKREL